MDRVAISHASLPWDGASEIVERKGLGHPDTLADGLAEALSRAYSAYTIEHFGAVLHHNFDKVGVLGGAVEVDFGRGIFVRPIRVLLTGRATRSFGDQAIPVRDLLEDVTRQYFTTRFGDLVGPKDIELHWFVSDRSGPGPVEGTKGSRAHLFSPRILSDVKGYDRLLANDTSVACGFAPMSPLEGSVLGLETHLSSLREAGLHKWLGSDIKVMGVRMGDEFAYTLCVPQVARFVDSLDGYLANLETIREEIRSYLGDQLRSKSIEVSLNTRDDLERRDVYLTLTGSSAESGDEGLVGRGNRASGLITPFRTMTIEAPCGKNPRYYTGKVYTVLAQRIAERILSETGVANQVLIVGQSGRPLADPWHVSVQTARTVDKTHVNTIVSKQLDTLDTITSDIVAGKVRLY